jgi:hypothetical protein
LESSLVGQRSKTFFSKNFGRIPIVNIY